MLAPQPSILFIDAYDSFTNNIISLLTTTLSCSVRVIHIDSPLFSTPERLHNELRHYDAVVCGPGPGDPSNEKDVGLMNRIWRLQEQNIVPVLGICLGFQSLCLSFGGKIRMLEEGLHGIVKRIRYRGEDGERPRAELFNGVGEVWATLYHSLCIDLGQDELSNSEWKQRMWDEFAGCSDLEPLAWVYPVDESDLEQTGTENGPILTAVRHRTKPFYGLQYHPESICTNKESKKVIRNWFASAQRWNRQNDRTPWRDQSNVTGELSVRKSLLSDVEVQNSETTLGSDPLEDVCGIKLGLPSPEQTQYESCIIDFPDGITIPDIVSLIQTRGKEHIVLESSNSHIQGKGSEDVRGRYSIIGINVESALQINYEVGNDWASLRYARNGTLPRHTNSKLPLKRFGGIWQFLAAFLEKRKIDPAKESVPFMGGFVGYTTYELGLEGINAKPNQSPRKTEHHRPDLCFAWVTQSVVVDHVRNKIHIQQLGNKAVQTNWLETCTNLLQNGMKTFLLNQSSPVNGFRAPRDLLQFITTPDVAIPDSSKYESKVLACQDSIRKGDSYELCLTDQTHVTISRICPNAAGSEEANMANMTSWQLYTTLRARQPAPFASFLRLGPATFVSCSPERFLTWNSSPGHNTCSLRPMKGTVRKLPPPSITTLAEATALLNVPKERAENLMIVDLVRHDLHGVCGPGNVNVPRLMVVEEYASVFQMISIVEGRIPLPPTADETTTLAEAVEARKRRYTGIDVLAASLPPGSMTGAPKKRSCEILQQIEGPDNDRSLYSGVVGYMDVGGRGDFSVNIRCMFRWDDEVSTEQPAGPRGEEEYETWHIGAGGAVTALSSAVAEREEMQTKLRGTLGIFGISVK